MTAEVITGEKQLGCGYLPPLFPQPFGQNGPIAGPLRAAMGVVLLPSDGHLGKAFSPGMEGSAAPSTQICLSFTDEGLRVYTTNSPILKAEREGHTQM